MKKKNLFLSLIIILVLFTIVSSCNKEEGARPISDLSSEQIVNDPYDQLQNQVTDIKDGEPNEALQEMEFFMNRYTASSFDNEDKAKIPVKLIAYKKDKSRVFNNDSLERKTYSFLAVTDYTKEDRIYNVILTKHKDKWGEPQLMEYIIDGYFENGYPILKNYARYKLKGWKVTGDRCDYLPPCESGTSTIGGSGGGGGGTDGSSGGGGSGTGYISGGSGAGGSGGGQVTSCSYAFSAFGSVYYWCGGTLFRFGAGQPQVFTEDCCEPLSGTGIVSPYVTPKTVQFYLSNNLQMKASYDSALALYAGNDDVKKKLDDLIILISNNPNFENFINESHNWSSQIWIAIKSVIASNNTNYSNSILSINSNNWLNFSANIFNLKNENLNYIINNSDQKVAPLTNLLLKHFPEFSFNNMLDQSTLNFLFNDNYLLHNVSSHINNNSHNSSQYNLARSLSLSYIHLLKDENLSQLNLDSGDQWSPISSIMKDLLLEAIKEQLVDLIPGATLATIGPQVFNNISGGDWLKAMQNAFQIVLDEGDTLFPAYKVVSCAVGITISAKQIKKVYDALDNIRINNFPTDFITKLYSTFRNKLNWGVNQIKNNFSWIDKTNGAKLENVTGQQFLEKIKEEFNFKVCSFTSPKPNSNLSFPVFELTMPNSNTSVYVVGYPDSNSGFDYTLQFQLGPKDATQLAQLSNSKYKIRF